MTRKRNLYPILTFLWTGTLALAGHEYVSVNDDTIILGNGSLIREIWTVEDGISSVRLSMSGMEDNYILESKEFSFLLNGVKVDGFSGWRVSGSETIRDEHSGAGIRLKLDGEGEIEGLQLQVSYMLYPELPLVRKWLRFTNTGSEDLVVEAVNVEDLQTVFSQVHTIVHHNYGRMKHLGSFTGNWYDPVVVLHHQSDRRGIAAGNEAPGVLKRTAYQTSGNNLEVGLTHPDQDFPFRKWLAPGETWETPRTFICLYQERDDGFAVIDLEVNDFVRRHMVPQIIRNEEKPLFVYNTWNPFRTFVSDSLVREVASAAADCGIGEFIIDDGWQVNTGAPTSGEAWGKNYGDWNVDREKFPGGLGPTFDHIRSLGMKPGLWMSIGSATHDAAVFQEHPEWFVRNALGEPGNLHYLSDESRFFTSCFGTGWVESIRDVILSYCNEQGLAYTKLDFAVAASAYVNDPAISGCYAVGHPYHRDHRESFIVIYERLLEMFDALHREFPQLFIDCTFETAGKLQLTDYAIALHADGNWLSNFEEPAPTGPLRIRQMAWWRTPAIPAASLVIGNARMDDPGFELALKSLIGTLPIVLGDPRNIPSSQRESIRQWSDWMKEMQEEYDYMSFRRDLPGFGEPSEGSWDGWMRINNDDHSGGIIGVFRHGAEEKSRMVFPGGLDPVSRYHVRLAPQGEHVLTATGKELMEKGFRVEIETLYDGKLFEIAALPTSNF